MPEKYSIGDKVEVRTKKGTYQGIVLPAPQGEEGTLMLKLDSGYNIGFKLKEISVRKIGEGVKLEKFPTLEQKQKTKLPSVSLIATGGTIGSRVDYKTGAVHMLLKPEELLANVPELNDIINLKNISRPFSLASEDMSPGEWAIIAKEVAKELNAGADGVIVTHGTDTLHYTAAALSFMLRNLNKPVALVGGQRSSDRGSFDGAQNLICAAHYCKSDIAEVSVVMHATNEDTYCFTMRGTKVRKMHTSRRDAFRPINDIPLAKIFPDGKIEILNNNFKKRAEQKEKIVADTDFEEKIALLKTYPGAEPEILEYYINNKYKGIVIEATGLGHVPTQTLDKNKSWLPMIKKAIRSGMLVCFAPQTLYGRLDPYVYSNARIMLEAGVVYLEDILPETAYVKLGWCLAHSKNPEEAKKLMLANLAGEFNKRIEAKAFLY